jgi:hypothetical protein
VRIFPILSFAYSIGNVSTSVEFAMINGSGDVSDIVCIFLRTWMGQG